MKYDFAAIEKKWQKRWEETKPYAAVTGDKRPKFYGLIEFPYPSGQGLHVGHPRPFTAMDIVTRKKRMEGYNVLYPIGFDAFGLPTENYAIKNHIHPAIVTKQNIANFTSQLKMLGYGFDWDRCIDTTDPRKIAGETALEITLEYVPKLAQCKPEEFDNVWNEFVGKLADLPLREYEALATEMLRAGAENYK